MTVLLRSDDDMCAAFRLHSATLQSDQMSRASDPTSSTAIVQLNRRNRCGLDNQPRSD
jgi:hypothetical protein